MPKIPIILNYNLLHYQIGITQLKGVGPIKAQNLLEKIPSLESLFHATPSELSYSTGYKPVFFEKMERHQALLKAETIFNNIHKYSIETLFYNEIQYPRRLKNCPDAPLLLYKKGNVSFNHEKMVAIVGTRDATNYGKELTYQLIESFKDQNIVVVSGLAHGIDAFVHQACIDFDIPNIAVLGNGVNRVYPATHRNLTKNLLKNGSILSEFVPETPPDRENFPKRNRIVAGLCDATIVVESKAKGGSLITANLANDYNRDVFAFPGSVQMPTSRGCNDLIRKNKAHLIQEPNDFLTIMNWVDVKKESTPVQPMLFVDLTPIQLSIIQPLEEKGGVQIDVLSHLTQLPISKLSQELFLLEMDGVVRSLPGKIYQLV